MAHVNVGDARVAYEVQGGGETVVLLHGTSQDRNGWMFQLPAISGSFRIVTLDFPGSGETVDGGGRLDLDDLVAAVVAVADAAGADRFHLAGYSLGAVVAAAVAAEVPTRVRSLFLLCGWAASDAHVRYELDLWRRLFEVDPELFLRHAFSFGFTREWFATIGDGVEAALAVAVPQLAPGTARQADLDTRVDVVDRLGRITAPTLVVGATEDRFLPFRHSEELAKEIPGARLEGIDAGHLCIAEKADEVASLLAAHLGENRGR